MLRGEETNDKSAPEWTQQECARQVNTNRPGLRVPSETRNLGKVEVELPREKACEGFIRQQNAPMDMVLPDQAGSRPEVRRSSALTASVSQLTASADRPVRTLMRLSRARSFADALVSSKKILAESGLMCQGTRRFRSARPGQQIGIKGTHIPSSFCDCMVRSGRGVSFSKEDTGYETGGRTHGSSG